MGPIILILLCLQCLLLGSLADGPSGNKCPPASGRGETCVCQADEGVIDLTPLSNTDGTPRYADLAGGSWTYSYNPCSTFQDSNNKGACDDVHLCQSDQYIIGGAPGDEEIWIDTNGIPYAYYEPSSMMSKSPSSDLPGAPYDEPTRIGLVYLLCDQTVKLEETQIVFIGELPRYHYSFNLTSCQVCPGGCHHKSKPSKTGTSAGAIGLTLMFLCIVAIVTYFVAGILIMKFYKKASGTDVIPNKSFWILVPFLIKDGFVFTFKPCVQLVRRKVQGQSYFRLN